MLRSLKAVLASLILAGCAFHTSSAPQPATAGLPSGPSLPAHQPGESRFEVFPLDRVQDATAIASDPYGSIWFTDYKTSRIGRVSGDKVVTFATPTRFSHPYDIVAAPDGNMWFTEWNGGRLGRITPDGTITEKSAHDINYLYYICVGPDGALWFTGAGTESNVVGRMTVTGQQTKFLLPASAGPGDITAGPDGRLWISGGDKIYRMTVTGSITLFKTIHDAYISGLVFGADGDLWFWFHNQRGGFEIGRLTTAGVLTAFPLGPHHLVSDLISAYGKIWAAYSDNFGDGVAEIGEDGTITKHFAPECYISHGLALGADGNIWFTCYKSIDAYLK